MKKISIFLPLLILLATLKAQVSVDNTTMTIEQYVQNVLVGGGISISNVQYNDSSANIVNPQVGAFNDQSSDVGLSYGLILGSGDVTMAAQLNTGGGSALGGTGQQGTDVDLASITTSQIFDEAVIEFDFVPTGDSISFQYVFASEEYDEFVCGTVNDAFGFFITGSKPNGINYNAQNIALIPDPFNPGNYTSTPVSINTINSGVPMSFNAANCIAIDSNFAFYNVFYTQNTSNTYEYDGKTVVLTAVAAVIPDSTYHIKLAIGDGGDGAWDSGVFIKGYSFSSGNQIQGDTITQTICAGDSIVVNGTVYNSTIIGAQQFFSNIGPNNLDSIVTINLTVLPELSSVFNQTLCLGDSVIINGTIYNVPITGTTEVFSNIGPNNCDSTVTINLFFLDTIDISVTANSSLLTSNQPFPVLFQWLDCNDSFSQISGATNQSYQAPNGSYAVEITDLVGCVDTSECINVSTVGIEKTEFSDNIILSPNPTRGQLTINLNEFHKEIQLRLTDGARRLIKEQNLYNTQIINLNIDGSKGIYFLEIIAEDKKAVFKVVKE